MTDRPNTRFREDGANAPPVIWPPENKLSEGVGGQTGAGPNSSCPPNLRMSVSGSDPADLQARVGRPRGGEREDLLRTPVPVSQLLGEYRRNLITSGNKVTTIQYYVALACSFVQWLCEAGYPLRSVDGKILREFLDSRLKRDARGIPERRWMNALKEVAGARNFVLFLEAAGKVDHSGEAVLANDLLEAFVRHRAKLGYRASCLDRTRSCCGHFLDWLHISRVSIRTVGRETVDDFCQHDCVCRGKTRYGHSRTGRETAKKYVAAFVRFLAEQGIVTCEQKLDDGEDEPEVLVEFATWLREQRGICEVTIHNHRRNILRVFSCLGWKPSRYDAAGIRKAMGRAFSEVSRTHAAHLSVSTRMYLRFLIAKRACRSALLHVVPKFSHPALAELPRYISEEEVQRVVNTCDSKTPLGLRDRAILLLLSRLGLRVGDVARLRCQDIDWLNGRIVVSGKSRRSVSLPLPQEVGDAILAYLEHGRPRLPHPEVFLLSCAPYSPFSRSGSVSAVVTRALERAGVESLGSRGGHVLRHSFATHSLRAGASLEVIGTVLRHESPRTTALYAKVDLPALHAIAQPWIGSGDGA